MSIIIKTDKKQIKKRVKNSWQSGLNQLSKKILQDCNTYCPDQKTIDSSLRASDLSKGILRWRGPGVKELYYTNTAWCERAIKIYGNDWAKIARQLFKGGMKS